ncbi:heterokaryon incompatibility protein-domain-containing protein [Dactylonectria macrodidyma]|uniref:Heterokaryon incompatibility protein-domain-containing protein n=1 Tax=Dactylonectria macrodidyma TaxID=307937 RepID=A0A9P9J0I2_9HYPO|nr:heterokaryon incompatibility protein-domain-containing protein [Dactylonectria macrodidyma]
MEIIRQFLDPSSARTIARRDGYCPACTDMLCTPEGIKALDALPGYRHYNRHQCRKSAQQECPLCELIFRKEWDNPRNTIGVNETGVTINNKRSEEEKKPLWFATRRCGDSSPSSYIHDVVDDWGRRMREGSGGKAWLDGGRITHVKPSQISQETWPWASQASISIVASGTQSYSQRPRCSNFLDGEILQEAKQLLEDCAGGRHEIYTPPRNGCTERYAALSYCCGGPQPLTATKHNIQNLYSGIEIHQLSQTLQDAIHVTRRLGLRYIWIDVLCIIQDSVEDKLFEMEKMRTVYRNVASEGFFKVARDYAPDSSCTMPVHFVEQPGVGNVTLAAKDSLGARYLEPLRTRGWAFQEAALSRRVMIFSGYDLQCHRDVKHQMFLNLGNLTQGTWNAMIGEYTSRSLAGIANELLQSKHLSPNIDRTYLIWLQGNRTALSSRAPTWSWACLDCPIIGFSVLQTPSRSERAIQINLGLDVDELAPESTCVYYILLDKHINAAGIDEGDPLWLYYVLGIVTSEAPEGGFQRLGSLRWDVDQPAEDKYTFGQRRRIRLV